MELGSALGSVTSMSNVIGPLHGSSVRCSGSCWVTLFSNIYPGREQIYILSANWSSMLILLLCLYPSSPVMEGREGDSHQPTLYLHQVTEGDRLQSKDYLHIQSLSKSRWVTNTHIKGNEKSSYTAHWRGIKGCFVPTNWGLRSETVPPFCMHRCVDTFISSVA